MRHKSAFLQQGGSLGPDDVGTISLHLWVEGGISTSHSLLHPVPKLDFFWRQQVALSSVVPHLPSLAHCMYCIIILLVAEFQTLLEFAAGFLFIAMRVSHRPFCCRELLSLGILLLYAVFRESLLRGI